MNKFPIEKSGVACATIDLDTKKIYLTQRKSAYQTGKFCCPGGMVEDNETILNAIVREMKEETGLEIEPTRFIQSIASRHVGGKSNVTFWFILFLHRGETLVNCEPEKHTDWKSYSMQEALSLDLMVSTSEILKNPIAAKMIK